MPVDSDLALLFGLPGVAGSDGGGGGAPLWDESDNPILDESDQPILADV